MPPKSAPNGLASKDPGAPNQTLYVKNLTEKVNKNEVKRALYMLFSTYGPVLDVVTARVGAKKQSMRGQAHIVMRDVQTSTQAMRALQGFDLFGKELLISYGKGQSNIIPKLRGTYEAPTEEAESGVQKSIFNAPPSAVSTNPVANGVNPPGIEPHGVKRPLEQDEQSDASMEEDEDDAPMDEDDSD